MIQILSETFSQIPDDRAGPQIRYELHDTLMSGFAMMFFQHRSLLQFQRQMERKKQQCNLQTIFNVSEVPSDTQMREILDGVEVEPLRRLLPGLVERVRRAGWAEQFKTSIPTGAHRGDYYTLMLDGSDYYHSTAVECAGCLHQEEADGSEHYRHTVVSATLVRAGSHRVWPLDVEEVRNGDGAAVQDCELTAAKRLIQRVRQEHRQMKLIVGGDDLYGHEPFVQLLQELRCHYVLVAKPTSHPQLFEWVDMIKRNGGGETVTWHEGPASQRRFFRAQIIRQVPLSAALQTSVTLVQLWQTNRHGKVVYHNSWVTDLDVDAENVAVVVRIGRSRWKIENEQFNIHKNHGYHLEHNYGHGQRTLSMVMYLLNLLAFIAHTILQLGDRLYQRCRAEETRQELWNALRSFMRHHLVQRWSDLLLLFLEDEGASP